MIVIIASALPSWLLKGSQSSQSFYASPHGVPSLAGSLQTRSVFARMKVSPGPAWPCLVSSSLRLSDWILQIVPDDAVPSSHSQTFAEFFSGQPSHTTEDLCPINK